MEKNENSKFSQEDYIQLKKELSIANGKAIRYELLFDLSAFAVLVIENSKFVDCNQEAVRMLGYNNKSELLNVHPSAISPENQPDGASSIEKSEELMSLTIKTGNQHFEWVHSKKNGEDITVEVWLTAIEHEGKIIFNTIWKDLTDIRTKEDKLKTALYEKELLIKEIHHRIKNNLQIVSSLLNIQSDLIEDKQAKRSFQNSKLRVNSMGIIHEMLYKKKNISEINYGEYIKELSTTILNSIKGEEHKVLLDLKSSDIFLNLDTAMPIGLIINEILTNSLKYGLKDEMGDMISIHLKELKEGKYLLEIGDNGIGYSHDIDEHDSESLGLSLIQTLTGQLNGTIQKDSSKKGTNYIIHFNRI